MVQSAGRCRSASEKYCKAAADKVKEKLTKDGKFLPSEKNPMQNSYQPELNTMPEQKQTGFSTTRNLSEHSGGHSRLGVLLISC